MEDTLHVQIETKPMPGPGQLYSQQVEDANPVQFKLQPAFEHKQQWIRLKSRQDMDALNKLIRPVPMTSLFTSSCKAGRCTKKNKFAPKCRDFQRQSMKLLNLTNMI